MPFEVAEATRNLKVVNTMTPLSHSTEKAHNRRPPNLDMIELKNINVDKQSNTAAKMQLRRQITLNAVQDPRARDHSIGNSSANEDQNSSVGGFPQSVGGYLSGGGLQTDNESARLSNVQPYKYNITNKLDRNFNIKKVQPS